MFQRVPRFSKPFHACLLRSHLRPASVRNEKEPKQRGSLLFFHTVYWVGSPIFRKDRGSNTRERREKEEREREKKNQSGNQAMTQ